MLFLGKHLKNQQSMAEDHILSIPKALDKTVRYDISGGVILYGSYRKTTSFE